MRSRLWCLRLETPSSFAVCNPICRQPDGFTVHVAYTVLFQFAMAVLAAIGFVLLERESQANRKHLHTGPTARESEARRLWTQFEPLWAVVLVSVAVALTGLILNNRPFVASPLRVISGPILLAAAAVLVIAAAKGFRSALVVLILFAAADLGYYSLSCSPKHTNATSEASSSHARSGSPMAAAEPRHGLGS